MQCKKYYFLFPLTCHEHSLQIRLVLSSINIIYILRGDWNRWFSNENENKMHHIYPGTFLREGYQHLILCIPQATKTFQLFLSSHHRKLQCLRNQLSGRYLMKHI